MMIMSSSWYFWIGTSPLIDGLEVREDLGLLLVTERGQLPLERELGQALVPPVDRLPQAVRRGLVGVVVAVHEGVGADPVVLHSGEHLLGSGHGLSRTVGADGVAHLLDLLDQAEMEQPEPQLPGGDGAPLRGRRLPHRRMRVLEGLRRLDPGAGTSGSGCPRRTAPPPTSAPRSRWPRATGRAIGRRSARRTPSAPSASSGPCPIRRGRGSARPPSPPSRPPGPGG